MRMLTPELEQIRFDALRHCDEHGIDDVDGLRRVMGALTQKAFLTAIEPYIKVKADVLALCPTPVTPQLSPEMQKTMDLADELIANEARRYGVNLDAAPNPTGDV